MRPLLVQYYGVCSLNFSKGSNYGYVTNCKSPNIPGREMFINLDYISVAVDMLTKCYMLAMFQLYCWAPKKYRNIYINTFFLFLSLTSWINVTMCFQRTFIGPKMDSPKKCKKSDSFILQNCLARLLFSPEVQFY